MSDQRTVFYNLALEARGSRSDRLPAYTNQVPSFRARCRKVAGSLVLASGGVESRHAGVDIENRNNPPPKHPLSGKAGPFGLWTTKPSRICARPARLSHSVTTPVP